MFQDNIQYMYKDYTEHQQLKEYKKKEKETEKRNGLWGGWREKDGEEKRREKEKKRKGFKMQH